MKGHGSGSRGGTLRVGPNVDPRVIGRGKVVVDASDRGAEVEGEGGVVEVDDHGRNIPTHKGGGVIGVEDKDRSRTVQKGVRRWGG